MTKSSTVHCTQVYRCRMQSIVASTALGLTVLLMFLNGIDGHAYLSSPKSRNFVARLPPFRFEVKLNSFERRKADAKTGIAANLLGCGLIHPNGICSVSSFIRVTCLENLPKYARGPSATRPLRIEPEIIRQGACGSNSSSIKSSKEAPETVFNNLGLRANGPANEMTRIGLMYPERIKWPIAMTS